VYRERSSLSTRSNTRIRGSMRMSPPRRRWNGVSWWYSLILLLPLLLIGLDQSFGIGPARSSSDQMTIRVSDSVSGATIPGAAVTVGEVNLRTDENGEVEFEKPPETTVVQIAAKGYQSVFGEAGTSFGSNQSIELKPLLLDAANAPATNEGETSAKSDATNEATEAPDVAPAATVKPTKQATKSADSPADPDVVASGVVLGENGEPVYSALVRAGEKTTRTKRDGTFALKGAEVSGGVFVTAPGYAKQQIEGGSDLSVQLERQNIKAVYLNGTLAGDAEVVADMIALIQRTEANAVVIDIKEGYVLYDTKVQFYIDAEAVRVSYDVETLVKQFEDAGIYTIARLVVFNDPVIAEAHHELAVQDDNGGVWRGADGGAWVNPFETELWQPNIDLAVEAANYGFDEIQYDYIRFPSDGDLTTADFGPDYSEEGRVGVIVDFLKESRKALAPTGAMLAVDVFGIVAVYPDDQGIGQRVVDIAPVVDYVCPMIYPSHFEASSIDVGGEPNALPYETIELSVALALQKMPGMELKLRPWLQDFSYGEPKYGPEEVRAQIDATEAQAGSGWLLWNAASNVTEDALKPE